ncbi:hypothetical protein [Nannocystis pusilla]|uniref:hypothetical protein n=1 Tax=Nannocystis pusilla TaxID=889268 RepID=UPI003B7CBF65
MTTFAQVKCGYVNDQTTCGPKPGNPVSCSSTKTMTGPGPCYSYAYVEVKAPNANVFFWDENTPAAPARRRHRRTSRRTSLRATGRSTVCRSEVERRGPPLTPAPLGIEELSNSTSR